MNNKHTPDLSDLEIPQPSDVPDDVIPLFGANKDKRESSARQSRTKIIYDIVMLILLVVDLCLIFADNLLMSELMSKLAQWGGFGEMLNMYQVTHHLSLSVIGGVFTLFWVSELLARWLLAIKRRTYYRWFFFPFVHWYEVLACFPILRALRLLRAGIIIKRLHDTGVMVIPKKWITSAQFYYHVILEELSDRVILTAIDNFREQMAQSGTYNTLILTTINRNRAEFESVVLDLLRRELAPKLQQAFLAQTGQRLSHDIGTSVEQALLDTPELRRYLKLIPIAGGMIESQITNVGRHIGENVTMAVNEHLFDEKTLDALMIHIAKGVANIDTTHPQLQNFVSMVINDALNAFEKQIKVQQWKHKEQLHL